MNHPRSPMDNPTVKDLLQELAYAWSALADLAKASELVSERLHVVQPFLEVYQTHGDIIQRAKDGPSAKLRQFARARGIFESAGQAP